jgi:bifunctional DNase/RNase
MKGRGRRGRTAEETTAYLTMSIHGFALDSIAQMPVVLLKDADETKTLPIWINSTDALYIVAELVRHDASVKSDRKDLLSALLDHLGTHVTGVVIDDIKDGLATASVELLDRVTSAVGTEAQFSEADERRFVDFLDGLDPSALGKYPM